MRKLNVIYNHNIFEAPYNQKEVRKTERIIKEKFGQDLLVITTRTSNNGPNVFFPDHDLIIAEHTFPMTADDKKALAEILFNSVKKLKSYEPIDVVVSFRKIEEDDLYLFDLLLGLQNV